MVAQMRRCLCLYGGLRPELAMRFTLHSCKATILSWASQLGIPENLRAAQGHHRLASQMVKKYGRDDVWPQIRCQNKIRQAVANGWYPATPLNRGLDTLEEDAGCLARLRQDIDLTESESESEADMSHCAESSAAIMSDDDGISSDEDECEEDASSSLAAGPWLLNTRSGWCHKSVQVMAGVKRRWPLCLYLWDVLLRGTCPRHWTGLCNVAWFGYVSAIKLGLNGVSFTKKVEWKFSLQRMCFGHQRVVDPGKGDLGGCAPQPLPQSHR